MSAETVETAEAALADPVAHLTHAVGDLERRLPRLTEACSDPEALDLAELFCDVQAARKRLHDMERELEHQLGRAMLADYVDSPTLRVERSRSRDRKTWDHDGWRRDVRSKVLQAAGLKGAQGVVTADGEVLPGEVLGEALARLQDVQGASAPKVTALRSLGLDPMDYCETGPGSVRVQVFRLADENDDERDE